MVIFVPIASTRMFEDVVQGQQVTIYLIEVREVLGIEFTYLMLLYILKMTS
jgi:hypothetical protein